MRKWQGAKKRQRAGWIEERKEDGAFMGAFPIYRHISRGPSSLAACSNTTSRSRGKVGRPLWGVLSCFIAQCSLVSITILTVQVGGWQAPAERRRAGPRLLDVKVSSIDEL